MKNLVNTSKVQRMAQMSGMPAADIREMMAIESGRFQGDVVSDVPRNRFSKIGRGLAIGVILLVGISPLGYLLFR